jgi:L-histidine N-alpha-methyltransferase
MSGALVFVDESQFPHVLRTELIDSLRERAINHKLHYESYKQAAKWLALHEAYSPARTDSSGAAIYSDAFQCVDEAELRQNVHVIGLGCGGGQKEAALVQVLAPHKNVTYTALDASLPLVLTARSAALRSLKDEQCHSVVCDLGTAAKLSARLPDSTDQSRLTTLFGVIPNFVPSTLLPQVAKLLRVDDLLLLSANLAATADYEEGVAAVLPQYDNELTRDWLITFLLDIGFDNADGELIFKIETDAQKLRRIAAYYHLHRDRNVCVYGEPIQFSAGERIRLFFSYRHTVGTISSALAEHQIEVVRHWTNRSGEEGVFLCRRRGHSDIASGRAAVGI